VKKADKLKITILGAGAMGCMMAGFLIKRHDVILVDVWKEHIEAINDKGLCIRLQGEETVVHPGATTDPEQEIGRAHV
jgi:2-dehydropantoate 2-reductase